MLQVSRKLLTGEARPRAKRMGVIRVPVTLRAMEKSRKRYQATFLVDTGATDTLAPGKALRAAGVKPAGRVVCELADGTEVEYEFGHAIIEFMDTSTAGRVIFGPDDCEPLLGVTAMESVGVVIDPRNETLRKLPTVRLK